MWRRQRFWPVVGSQEAMSENLLFPLVFWDGPPRHDVTAIASGNKFVVTGSLSGELCLWKVTRRPPRHHDGWLARRYLRPVVIMAREGGARVTALARVERSWDELEVIVCGAADGTLSLWDASGGRCHCSRRVIEGCISTILVVPQGASKGRDLIACCERGGRTIELIDLHTLAGVRSLEPSSGRIIDVCIFKRGGNHILVALVEPAMLVLYDVGSIADTSPTPEEASLARGSRKSPRKPGRAARPMAEVPLEVLLAPLSLKSTEIERYVSAAQHRAGAETKGGDSSSQSQQQRPLRAVQIVSSPDQSLLCLRHSKSKFSILSTDGLLAYVQKGKQRGRAVENELRARGACVLLRGASLESAEEKRIRETEGDDEGIVWTGVSFSHLTAPPSLDLKAHTTAGDTKEEPLVSSDHVSGSVPAAAHGARLLFHSRTGECRVVTLAGRQPPLVVVGAQMLRHRRSQLDLAGLQEPALSEQAREEAAFHERISAADTAARAQQRRWDACVAVRLRAVGVGLGSVGLGKAGTPGAILDPYLQVWSGDELLWETEVLHNNRNPHWEDVLLEKSGIDATKPLRFVVFDKKDLVDDFVGVVELDLKAVLALPHNSTFPLLDKDEFGDADPSQKTKGSLRFKVVEMELAEDVNEEESGPGATPSLSIIPDMKRSTSDAKAYELQNDGFDRAAELQPHVSGRARAFDGNAVGDAVPVCTHVSSRAVFSAAGSGRLQMWLDAPAAPAWFQALPASERRATRAAVLAQLRKSRRKGGITSGGGNGGGGSGATMSVTSTNSSSISGRNQAAIQALGKDRTVELQRYYASIIEKFFHHADEVYTEAVSGEGPEAAGPARRRLESDLVDMERGVGVRSPVFWVGDAFGALQSNPCTASVLAAGDGHRSGSSASLLLARGYRKGNIVAASLLEQKSHISLEGHSAEVTCMAAIPPKFSPTRGALLVSGSLDGTLCLWDLEKQKRMGRFSCDSPVLSVTWPPGRGAGPGGVAPTGAPGDLVLAVTSDNAVHALSLSGLEVVQVFEGHDARVVAVHRNEWAVCNDYIVTQTLSGTAYIWCLSTGHLDRVLPPGEATRFFSARKILRLSERTFLSNENTMLSSLMADTSPAKAMKTAQSKFRLRGGSVAQRRASLSSSAPAPAQRHEAALLQVCNMGKSGGVLRANMFCLNVNRLIAALRTQHRHLVATGGVGTLQALLSYLFEWGVDPAIDRILKRQFGFSRPFPKPAFGVMSLGSRAASLLLPGASGGNSRWELCPALSAIHSLSLSALCMTMLKTNHPSKQVYYTHIVSHYGVQLPGHLRSYVEPSVEVLVAYSYNKNEEIHTAAKLLLQGVIERSPTATLRKIVDRWTSRRYFNPNSLSLFTQPDSGGRGDAKGQGAGPTSVLQTWTGGKRDRAGTGVGAAKSKGRRKSPGRRVSTQSVPALAETGFSRGAGAAAGGAAFKVHSRTAASPDPAQGSPSGRRAPNVSPFYEAPVLSKDTATDRRLMGALVLCLIAADQQRKRQKQGDARRKQSIGHSERKASADGKDDPIKIPTSVVRQITETLLQVLYSISSRQDSSRRPLSAQELVVSALAAELMGKGFFLWRRHVADVAGLISRLHRLSLFKRASLAGAAHRALLQAGLFAPRRFIVTMGGEALNLRAQGRCRSGALFAIVALVKKYPSSLISALPTTVQIIIKCLDPSASALRKSLLRPVTAALHALVKNYPCVSFHQKSQRFAVGTDARTSSVIVIYDLRTATKWRILSGHKGTITAVCFNPSATKLASYAPDESPPVLKFWETGSSGLLTNLLGIQGQCVKTVKLPAAQRRGPASAKAMGEALLKNRIVWISPRMVKLRREDGTITNHSI